MAGRAESSTDVQIISDSLKNATISGPWRLTVWESDSHPPSYVFSEEHGSEGSCPDERGISSILMEILDKTAAAEVFIEHFVHAEEMVKPRQSEEKACSSDSHQILNGLRLCLEVVKMTTTDHANRIHFCDPRCDIVCVMPDGKVYEAIDAHVRQLQADNNVSDALLTIYEAFIHPLLSVVPDSTNLRGRLSGSIKQARQVMTPDQLAFFDETWKQDVVTSIRNLTTQYTAMHTLQDVSKTAEFMTQYTRTINKFMDTWLLAQMFHSENTGMSASVLYLGSLHSLNIEKYLERYGYRRASLHESNNLAACLTIK